MDSQEVPDNGNKGFHYTFFRIAFALLFPIVAFFSLSFLAALVATFMGELSISNPISVPTQCKIVSSSVDIRSSKVCDLGVLNYKAKHVFYPFERSKYRCRYDYYWTSVFEVEYLDHSLGQTRLASAEAPDEALPLSCRPNFGAAWLAQHKFKVNETYNCWYTSGVSTVKLYNDGFFSCQAKDPSTVEIIKRYLIISTKILRSWFSSKRRPMYLRWEMIAGVVTGFSTAIIVICFASIFLHLKSCLRQAINTVHIKRVCFLLAYFSFMGWLVSQYWKRLNIPVIKVYDY